jgi:hypothetical protein
MMSLKSFGMACNYLSALAAFSAAVLWYQSARAKVSEDDAKLTPDPELIVEGTAFVASVRLQTMWSKYASIAAGIAALLQAIGIAVNTLCSE